VAVNARAFAKFRLLVFVELCKGNAQLASYQLRGEDPRAKG
jgi:hypothetical protein